MKLYEFNELYKNIDDLDPEQVGAEVIEQAFNSVDGDYSKKAENIVKFTKCLEADEEVIDKEIKRLQALKKAKGKKRESILEYLQGSMKSLDKREVKSSLFSIKIAKKPASVVVEDMSLIPTQLIRTKTIEEVDKVEIKKLLKEGLIVPGARLEQGERLAIK